MCTGTTNFARKGSGPGLTPISTDSEALVDHQCSCDCRNSLFWDRLYVVVGNYTREQHLKCVVDQAKDAITLTKKLGDGTVEQRVISLSEDTPERVQVSFRLVQGDTRSQMWRFNSQTGFDPGTHTQDAEKLTVYAKAPEWKVVNRGWRVDDGPGAKTLQQAKGGGLAFYNHEAKFGALITYLPQELGQV